MNKCSVKEKKWFFTTLYCFGFHVAELILKYIGLNEKTLDLLVPSGAL